MERKIFKISIVVGLGIVFAVISYIYSKLIAYDNTTFYAAYIQGFEIDMFLTFVWNMIKFGAAILGFVIIVLIYTIGCPD